MTFAFVLCVWETRRIEILSGAFNSGSEESPIEYCISNYGKGHLGSNDYCKSDEVDVDLTLTIVQSEITKIKITNRINDNFCCWNNVDGNYEIFVDTISCGVLTGTKRDYEINCPIGTIGDTITVKVSGGVQLELAQIESYGFERKLFIFTSFFVFQQALCFSHFFI